MKKFTTILILCQGSLNAGPRSSDDYEVSTDLVASGGGRSSGGVYSNIGTVGDVSGVSTVADPATTARHGFVGQLYEVLGYELRASNYYPAEEDSTQFTPLMNLDDGTIHHLPHADFSYSVFNGPITAVSPSGLVQTGQVHVDTPAVVRATSLYFVGTIDLNLTVLDTLPDNFGSYAADGLPDTWQFTHFGLNNPLAAALLDPDGDGQNNLFEYTAGIIPTDPASRFLLHVETVPGEPTHKELKFSPIHPGRSYTVKSNTTLTGGTWEALTVFTDDNSNPERTVIDQAASEPRKFYQVEISKP